MRFTTVTAMFLLVAPVAARAAAKHAALDTALIEQLTGAKGQLDDEHLARGLRDALDHTSTRVGMR